jgi:hypothetical protein
LGAKIIETWGQESKTTYWNLLVAYSQLIHKGAKNSLFFAAFDRIGAARFVER